MEWFSWLSKTNLEPNLVYEYGLAFSQNELEKCDIAYFNHEFLQSMGISIAKHRLEILKLARKEKETTPHPVSKILIAIKRTKTVFSKYFRAWIKCEESALAIVPRQSYSGKWKNSMLKRNKKLMVASNQNRSPLLLTNGSQLYFPSARINSFSSPLVHEYRKDDEEKIDAEDSDEYWCSTVEEIRWDTMFQNLKPT